MIKNSIECTEAKIIYENDTPYLSYRGVTKNGFNVVVPKVNLNNIELSQELEYNFNSPAEPERRKVKFCVESTDDILFTITNAFKVGQNIIFFYKNEIVEGTIAKSVRHWDCEKEVFSTKYVVEFEDDESRPPIEMSEEELHEREVY